MEGLLDYLKCRINNEIKARNRIKKERNGLEKDFNNIKFSLSNILFSRHSFPLRPTHTYAVNSRRVDV